jgi:hypothetical protein
MGITDADARRDLRTADVLRTALAGAAVMAMAAGCGSTVDGNATTSLPSSSNSTADIFNPCTQLSDDVLRATGVDPTTKRVTTDAPTGPTAWRICGWLSPDLPYMMSVASSSHTQEESRANPKLTGFRDVMIGPRRGLIYQDKSDTKGEICYGWLSPKPITRDRCELAVKHATDLEPHLPK